jgi:hypothetical protein
MIETTKALRSKLDEHHRAPQAAHIASRQWMSRWGIPGLLCAGLALGFASHAEADPVANQIYSNCTFTDADLMDLDIDDVTSGLLNGGHLRASYIIIYVRETPNDGQEIFKEIVPPPPEPPFFETTNTFTGPILCTNFDSDIATSATEADLIPDSSGTVDILGAEEASHLQYVLTDGAMEDTEKRVCHTVAGNTDCFSIKPKP